MKKTLLSKVIGCMCAVMCLGLMACGQKKAEESAASAEPEKPKVLVLYYSQTGATKTLAEEVQKQLGCDIEAIECEVPYEGDFAQTIQRCQDEKADGIVPNVKPLNHFIGDYDVIFLGYPVWFGSYASPITGLLHSQSFDGMKIVTFCTFGSGGLESSTADLRKVVDGDITEGFGVRNARIQDAEAVVNRFLIEAGYKEGKVDPLAAFEQHHVCSAEEQAIYHQACDDYQYPFGAPVDVASRETPDGTEYEFAAVTADGRSLIYVTQPKAEDEKAYFTRVVRKEL